MIDAEHDSVIGPGRNCSTLAWMTLKALVSPSARRSPSAVGRVPWPLRSSSSTPSWSSSERMCRLTAPWVTNSSSAAALMLPRRTVVSNARSAFSEGLGVVVAIVVPQQACEFSSQW